MKDRSEDLNAPHSEHLHTLSDEDISTNPVESRRSALGRVARMFTSGAAGTLLYGCYYESGESGGSGGSSYGGGGRARDMKFGDRSDVTIPADFQDLDSDSRDTSDHFRARQADGSGDWD